MRSVKHVESGPGFPRLHSFFWLSSFCLAVSWLLPAPAGAATGSGESGVFLIDNSTASSGPRLTSLTSTYQGVFVQNVNVSNTFTATVNWSGKTPQKVVFQLNGVNADVTTSGNTAQRTYNMGTALQYALAGKSNELRAWAVAADGSQSQPLSVKLWGLLLPEWAVSAETQWGSINFRTDPQTSTISFDGNVILLADGIEGTVTVPDSIPEIGGQWGVEVYPLNFAWALTAQPGGTGLSGQFSVDGNWGGKLSAGGDRSGAIKAGLGGAGQFNPGLQLTDISAFLNANLEFKFPRVPLLCQWSGCCDPTKCPYFQASVAPGVGGRVAMEQGEPALIAGMKFKNGELSLEATVKGTVGLGDEDGWVGATGTIGGKPYVTLQFPADAVNSCSVSDYVKEAGVDLLAEVTAKLGWFKREWDWEFNIYHCPETGESYQMVTPLSGKNGAVQIIERDYLAAQEGYCVFPEKTGEVVIQAVPGLPEPILNVGDLSTPSIAAGSNHGLLLFVFDDASKPTGKHQEIYYARWDGGAWTANASLTDNLQPDMQPVAALDSANTEIAAWVQMDEPDGTETGPRDILPGSEIVYSTYDAGTESWAAVQPLTSNTYADMLPWFEQGSTGGLRLCWVASETNAIPVWHDEEIAPLADVMAADWNGGFGTPYLVASDLQTASRPAVIRTDTHEFLAYILDADNDASTGADREVVVRHRVLPDAWEADVQLTSDNLTDSAVRMGLDSDGKPVVAWVKRMVPVMLPDDEESSVDQLWYTRWNGTDWDAPAIGFEAEGISEPRMMRSAADRLVLFWVAASQEFADIYYAVFDSTAGQWGRPQQITHDQGAETMIALAETDGNILAAYVKQRIDLDDPSGVPQIGLSDLYLMEHQPDRDLSVNASGITFDPEPLVRAQNATICAEVLLRGDFVVADVPVDFYDGDPDESGMLIGSDTISTLLPGERKNACVDWAVPDDGLPHEIHVLVDPLNTIPETDTGNNRAGRVVFLPDLRVTSLQYMGSPDPDRVLIGLAVGNSGDAVAGPSVCLVRDSESSEVLFVVDVPALEPGEIYPAQFTWDVTDVDAGIYSIGATADIFEAVEELNEENNLTVIDVPVLADLRIEQWSIRARPGLGRATITNVGAKPGSATVVRVTDDEENALGEAAVSALAPGESESVAVPFAGASLGDMLQLAVNPDSNGSDDATLANNSAAALVEIGLAPDLDLNSHVDMDDYDLFLSCATGALVPHDESDLCQVADFDNDGDVDQMDFAIFQRCISGDEPADPACME